MQDIRLLCQRTPLALFALLFAGLVWAQSPFSGSWEGGIVLPSGNLDIAVTLDLEQSPPTGTIDIPAQGVQEVALEEIIVTENRIRFSVRGIPGDPTFQGTLEDVRIEGALIQSGSSIPFSLERAGVPETEVRYADPQGFYSVPVPVNWTVETRDGYGVLASPDGGIHVFVLSLEASDLDGAVPHAWELIDPDFARQVAQTIEPPPSAGLEAMKVFLYETPAEQIVQTIARLHNGRVYIMTVDAKVAALQERQSQVVIIDSGFEIAGLGAEDISGREPRTLTPELLEELEQFIHEAMTLGRVPGLAISVVRDGEIVYAEGFGVRELGSGDPVTPETLMMIGSTGKTMTTLMMATLVDAGLLSWDTPVVDILPQFRVADPDLTRQITVRHLVCACTGVPRRDAEILFNAEDLTAEEVIESLADFRFFTGFGEAFQYSNQMVATGGYVAAAADGATYGELFDGYVRSMYERVFEPIGMESTYLRFEDVLANENRATPHGMYLDMSYQPINVDLERFVLPVAPAGIPWSNVLDMGRYLATQLSYGIAPDGTRVVSETNLRETWRGQVPVSADTEYALGWKVGTYKGLDLIAHGGNTIGFTSDLAFLPTERIGVSILTNARATNVVNEAIRARLFELLYDLEPEAAAQLEFQVDNMRQALAATSRTPRSVNHAAVEPFLGAYANPALGSVEVRLERDALVWDVGEFETELQAQDSEGTKYVVATPPFPGLELTFEMRGGEPTVVLGQGVEGYVFERP